MNGRTKKAVEFSISLLFLIFFAGCGNDIAETQSIIAPPVPPSGGVVLTPFEGTWEYILDDYYTIKLIFQGDIFVFTQNEITINRGTFTYTENTLTIYTTHRYNGSDLVPLTDTETEIQQGNYILSDTVLTLLNDSGSTEYTRTE
jgi:hypothetical protein